jgi:2-polyprenyl-6-methoxyphenol hydroxylase-like FAD-dependent oxidoreductase
MRGSPPWRRTQVAIVGGGVAGLAAAWWLQRAGLHDLLVLELDDVLGGGLPVGLVRMLIGMLVRESLVAITM